MTNISQREKQIKECKKLVEQKDIIEAKIQDFESVLRSSGVGMKTPLIDDQGYPRADIDVYAIRNTRATLIPLYNDLDFKLKEIETALHLVHATPAEFVNIEGAIPTSLHPIAIINGVMPDSPADRAGLQRNDHILIFGTIDSSLDNPLQEIAKQLASNENVSIFSANYRKLSRSRFCENRKS
jgi:26S proteasome non-ATPase regulatory subunit 9